MSSPGESDAAALRAQLAAVTAERDAAVARASAAEAEAAAALQRVASLELLLARGSDSGGGADDDGLLDDSDADAAEADTAVAGPPLNPPARRPGDIERQYGDAAAEPPAPEAANPFARAFDPAQEVREQYAAAQAVLAQRAANAEADAAARKREHEAEQRLARRCTKRTGHQLEAEENEDDVAEEGGDGGGAADAAPEGAAAHGRRRIVKAKRPVLPAGAAEAAPNPFASIVIAPPPAAP